jgi:hypothetical protein
LDFRHAGAVAGLATLLGGCGAGDKVETVDTGRVRAFYRVEASTPLDSGAEGLRPSHGYEFDPERFVFETRQYRDGSIRQVLASGGDCFQLRRDPATYHLSFVRQGCLSDVGR